MNILMVSLDYPPVVGGIAAHVCELSRALREQGHTVSVVTRRRGGEPARQVQDGIAVHRVKLRLAAPLYGLQLRGFIRSLLPELQPEVIHLHGMAPLEWYDIHHLPLIYTNHTSGYLRRIEKGGWRRMRMLKSLFAKVDLFIAPSRELLEIPFAIRADRFFIANGVDGEKYARRPNVRKRVRNRLALPEEMRLAIVTRRLVEKNGVIHLARATARLRQRNLAVLVIGDGPERARVEREMKTHLGERAIFLGSMLHQEIIDYYSGADFSILPSLMEATSISGLEAMAAGLPLVGTRVGGIPELIEDGCNGLLCHPADPDDLAAKTTALLDMDLEAMGRRSRELVAERFTWPVIAEQTVAAYRTLLG